MALQVGQHLQSQFPGLEVELSNYPPPPLKLYAANAVRGCQLAAAALLLGGERAFALLGFAQPPAWYADVSRNRIGALGAVFIVGNVLTNGLVSTGAFEISYGQRLLFSKLAENRLPSQEELIHAVSGALHSGG